MTYTPQAPMGAGYVSWGADVLLGEEPPDPTEVWDRIEETIRRAAPEVDVSATQGPSSSDGGTGLYTNTWVDGPAVEGDECCLSSYGPPMVVADDAAELGLTGEPARLLDGALAAGRLVLFTLRTDVVDEATIRSETWRDLGDEPESTSSDRVPAQLVAWDDAAWGPAPAMAVLPVAMARDLGMQVATTQLRLTGDLDEASETRIREAVQGAVDGTDVYVERGYERPDEAVIILLVLGALGGVLMLGGTLTATFLALSDARPDLATLSAVGAAPRARRRVAAAYALVIGIVGAILGAGVGFIPGIAISRPLTAGYGGSGTAPDGPFLAIPWLLIVTIVVALPLLTAAVVGLTARSRLPLVARLD